MAKIDYLPRFAVLALFLVIVICYSLFQARFLILGPRIEVTTPRDGATSLDELVIIDGYAKNAAWITLNGRQIFTDEKGFWSEKLLVNEGLSIMTIQARDRFGREKEKQVRIFLN